jgi:hexosaminidase
MKRWNTFIITAWLTGSISMIASCAPQPVNEQKANPPTTPGAVSIVPQPMKMQVGEGVFTLEPETLIVAGGEAQSVGEYLADTLAPATGYKLKVKNAVQKKGSQIILMVDVAAAGHLGPEGYTLQVLPGTVFAKAATPRGLFYACQSIRQLLPPQIESKKKVKNIAWTIPAVEIEDKPRYSWRGMHLDVGRHYFDVDFIKKYIDMLVLHKMNTFHWHLTEDQGWRVEIKKYPKLTEISAWREGENGEKYPDGKKYGGFYTQDQIREVVAYAQERFVTVVPEIEMPGHTVAVLTAYPELSCTGGPFNVREQWGIAEDVFCAGNEKTFEFIENVLTEVVELFPGTYFHIGGDESPKARWEKCPKCQARIKAEGLKDEHELQSYFIKRVEKFLLSKKKRLIGWDEILEGGLAPNAAVMSWRGMGGGIAAATQGHDVVMSPTSHCYFDYYQGDPKQEPKAIGGYLPLEKVYSFEPTPENLTREQAQHILGAQGNVWTEYMATTDYVEYMAAPRLCALAEVVWSPKELRDWDSFQKRLGTHLMRLDGMKVNYRLPEPSGFGGQNAFINDITIEMQAPLPDAQVRYTLDGTDPTTDSKIYTAPIRLTENTTVKAVTVMPSGRTSYVRQGTYEKQQLQSAVTPSKLEDGVNCKYFEGRIWKMAEWDKLKLVRESGQDTLVLPKDIRDDNFAVELTGYIKIAREGIYTFYTSSDDGSVLYLHDKLVVNNDGDHGNQEKSGQIALAAGYHPIKVRFFELGGAENLSAAYMGPGLKKQMVPASILFHD